MSEHQRHRGEHLTGPQNHEVSPAGAEMNEKAKSHEVSEEKHLAEQQKSLEAARKHINKEAKHGQDLPIEAGESSASNQFLVNKELKGIALQRVLTRTRKQLSAPGRLISRIIHQPVVEAVSSAAEKTIARPSGFLIGSIVACAGSAIFLYAARTYGFRYNFLTIIFLFVGGYLLGTTIELVWRLIKIKQK